jgi:hypothetical protein
MIIHYFLFSIVIYLIKREGASEGTVGSLDLYKYCVIISGTPKNSEKEMGSLFIFGHFKNVQISKCED